DELGVVVVELKARGEIHDVGEMVLPFQGEGPPGDRVHATALDGLLRDSRKEKRAHIETSADAIAERKRRGAATIYSRERRARISERSDRGLHRKSVSKITEIKLKDDGRRPWPWERNAIAERELQIRCAR